MTVLKVVYLKGRAPVKKFTEADHARIFELGGKHRKAQLKFSDSSKRGILPEEGSLQDIEETEMDKLFGNGKKESSLTANQKEG